MVEESWAGTNLGGAERTLAGTMSRGQADRAEKLGQTLLANRANDCAK